MNYAIERKSNRRPAWAVAHETRTEQAALDFLAWCVETYSTSKQAARLGVQFRMVTL